MAAGACPLTPRQYQVVLGAMQGLTYGQIALRLGIGETCIRTHMHRARRRLGVVGKGAGALSALMLKEGWVEPELLLDPEPTAVYLTWLQSSRRARQWAPSPAQRLYLTAFDRLLRRRDAVSAAAMDLAFRLMCWEAGCPIPRQTFAADTATERVDEMLLRLGRSVTRGIPT